MIYLFFSILFSVATVSFFKLFEKYQVNTFPAIVINYFSCVVMGNLLAEKAIVVQSFWLMPWFIYTVFLGFMFITIFYAIGKTSQLMGISVSMVAAKLSVVIPVSVAIFIHHESLNWMKLLGILFSLLAVYLISQKDVEKTNHRKSWILPFVVFVGSGLIDTGLKHVEKNFIPPADAGNIISTIFFIAACMGTAILLIQLYFNKAMQFGKKEIIWGIALGLPNYFSMFFLVKTLQYYQEASVVFPINNIGIAGLSTLVSFMIFKEGLNKQNKLGLLLAAIAMIILSF